MNATERYPETLQFLGGYLHQDWPEDYATADEAVRVAIAESDAKRLRGVERELPTLLRLPEDDLRAVLAELCDYYPPGDGRSWRGWLEEVHRAVSAASR